jgi:hypothetical protein
MLKERMVFGLCRGHGLRWSIITAIVSLVCSNTVQANAGPHCRIDLQAALNLGFLSDLAVVETKINGVPGLLGLDTGAKTLLTPEAVKAMGLIRHWRRTRSIGTTAVVLANNYIVDDLEFAGRHYRDRSVPVLALRQDKGANSSIKGLIGTDILADFDLDFDFPNRKLNVYTVTGCKTVTPPGFTAAASMNFSFNDQRGAVLAAELDGKKLTALIDTGATSFAITRTAASRLKVTASSVNTDLALETTGAGNVTVKQLQHQFRSLSFGNETIRDPLFGIINTPVTTGDILLGQRFLFSRRFFISNATRMLFLGKAPAPVFTYTPSTVLRLSPERNGDSCKDGAPQAVAGDCDRAASAKPGEKAFAPASTPSTLLPLSPDGNDDSCKDGSNCVSPATTSPEEKAPAPAFTYTPSTVFRLPPKRNGDGCKDGPPHGDSAACMSAADAKSEQKDKQ